MASDLQKLREQAGWSQFELAAATGIERTRLSLIENGHIVASAYERGVIRTALLAEIAVRAGELKAALEEAVPEK